MTKIQARLAGRDAYWRGDSPHCPYTRVGVGTHEIRSGIRTSWYVGYYEARLADKLPNHFSLEPLGD